MTIMSELPAPVHHRPSARVCHRTRHGCTIGEKSVWAFSWNSCNGREHVEAREEMKGYPVQSTVKMVEGKLSFDSESLDEIKGDSYWIHYQQSKKYKNFHTPQERKYLGKVVCTVSGDLDKLYIESHVVRYRLPYILNWTEDDEVAIFIRNYADIIQKTDLDFWKLDVYLDKNNFYLSHTKIEYCCGLHHVLQSKTNK